ncbi:exopolysaccharide biosynthesis polyprenyl glycosylphosphotransferase [Streptomyces sp. CA-111067]|uniref:exopolysaccharide biosynthesis polyprenyl glycosylphosphotransferase n=1 Tax=Streptomyces sp. CA-111067 TaxID=3240046 RepID=UPI003D97A640
MTADLSPVAAKAGFSTLAAQPTGKAGGGTPPTPAASGGGPGTPAATAAPTPGIRRGAPRHRRVREWGAVRMLVAADCVGGLAGFGVVGPGMGFAVLGGVLGGVVLAHRRAGLYRPGFAPAAFRELPAVTGRVALVWGAVAAGIAAFDPGHALDWAVLAVAIAVTVVVTVSARAVAYRARRWAARRRPASTLIVGGDRTAEQVAAALHAHPEYGMRPVGIVARGALELPLPGLPVLGDPGDVTRAVIQNAVRHAVVTCPQPLDDETTATVRLLAARGCQVWQVTAGRHGTGPGSPPAPDHLWGFACRRLDPYPATAPASRTARAAKRALDASAAALALLCLAPVLAACALAVRLTDGPGVLFRQERIGLNGRPFTLLKFRTLRPADAHESATLWSVAHDSRMSTVGRLLRRSSMDELPQFWNVLRGDMSLVGPRPERPYYVSQFSQTLPGYRDRHRMPVGITGLAQVNGLRGDTSIADRARFDNHYIDSWSFWQDVSILLRTATSLFRFGGS